MRRFLIFKKVCIVLILVSVIASTTACFNRKRYKYYASKDNYISVTGTVSHIKYSEAKDYLVIALDDMSATLSDNNFQIIQDNLAIVQSNGFDELVNIGSEITIIIAPHYFGDGYLVPIVALEHSGTTLLEFDDGYDNLLNWLS